jgi:hypothetical protein
MARAVEAAYSEGLASEAHRLLSETSIRPTAARMAELVLQGLTDEHLKAGWESLGHQATDTDLLVEEIDALAPQIALCSDVLAYDAAKDTANNLHIFAARDGEVLSDDFWIVHGAEHDSTLMPASMPLWRQARNRRWLVGENGRIFLSSHGTTRERATDENNTFTVVDTGFNGTAGKNFGQMVEAIYGVDTIRAGGRLAIRLVHANPGSDAATITEPYGFAPAEMLPRTRSWLGAKLFESYLELDRTTLLATALQILPRYHGTYKRFRRQDDNVLAIPLDEGITADVNVCDWKEHGENNDSIVNPLAAAIVQRHVVASALQRSGQLQA